MNEILNFQFRGKNYSIEFPKVGQYREIDVFKQTLSMGQYGSMFRTMTAQSEESLDMVDMEAYFSVLSPKLIKSLGVESFSNLDLLTYKELKVEYRKQFIPWWNEIEKMLRPEPVKKETEDGEEQD